jgi:hypothetical protein
VLILTFVLAMLNICLGFALAMYLGYGPSRISEEPKESDEYRSEPVSESETMTSTDLPNHVEEAAYDETVNEEAAYEYASHEDVVREEAEIANEEVLATTE